MSASMPNMCSATIDLSKCQSNYIKKYNAVDCFFKSLSTISQEIKNLVMFLTAFENLCHLHVVFISYEKLCCF